MLNVKRMKTFEIKNAHFMLFFSSAVCSKKSYQYYQKFISFPELDLKLSKKIDKQDCCL